MRRRIGMIDVLLVGMLALGLFLVSETLTIFADNTVTVTARSPAIEINGIQYKYEYFPFKLEANEVINTLGGLSICEEEISYEQLIGRWNNHKLVVNYEYIRVPQAESAAGGCNQIPRQTQLSELDTIGIRVKDAYYDGQFIEIDDITKLAKPEKDTQTEDFIWVNINGIIAKFIINTDVPDRGYRGSGLITASIYVPSDEFEERFCGDSNCDLNEDCLTCEQDCGVCVVRECGNGVCSEDENYYVCPADCEPADPFCGDAFCNGAESCLTCSQDCGECNDAYCGDSECNADETCVTCQSDCGACPPVCGNGVCDGDETQAKCPIDCGVSQDIDGGLPDEGKASELESVQVVGQEAQPSPQGEPQDLTLIAGIILTLIAIYGLSRRHFR